MFDCSHNKLCFEKPTSSFINGTTPCQVSRSWYSTTKVHGVFLIIPSHFQNHKEKFELFNKKLPVCWTCSLLVFYESSPCNLLCPHRMGLKPHCWGVPRSPTSRSSVVRPSALHQRRNMLIKAIARQPMVQRRRLAIEFVWYSYCTASSFESFLASNK